MYTLISHGSRIQVAQFHRSTFEAFGSEVLDTADKTKAEDKTDNKPDIDTNTVRDELRTVENNERRQEEIKNRIATAKSKEAISNIGMNPDSLKFQLFSQIDGALGLSAQKINLAQSTVPLAGSPENMSNTASNTPEALPEKTHIIKSGDTLSKIAQVNGTTVAELQRINSLTDSNKIRVGETLHIPSSNIAATAVASAPANVAPTMPKPKINTTPNTPKITVASKPAEAPKVAVKTLQQELEEANKELGSAVYGKTLPAANKDYYTNLENTARANIATIEQKIKNQEKAAQYAGFSENKKIWADFSDKYNKLQKESVTAGSAFTMSTEFKQAEKDVIMSNTIVKRDTEIAGLNTKYNTLMATNTPAAANERVAMRGTIDSLIKLNETQMAVLKGSPSYASIQASKKLA